MPTIPNPPKALTYVYKTQNISGNEKAQFVVTLQCGVTGDTTNKDRVWGSTSTINLPTRVNAADGSLTLGITEDGTASVQGKDYWCFAANDVGKVISTNATLKYAEFNLGQWDRPTGEVEAFQDFAAVIPCRVPKNAQPFPVVEWTVNGDVIESSNSDYSVSASGDLDINVVKSEMNGKKYSCRIVNHHVTYTYESDSSATLTVKGTVPTLLNTRLCFIKCYNEQCQKFL